MQQKQSQNIFVYFSFDWNKGKIKYNENQNIMKTKKYISSNMYMQK